MSDEGKPLQPEHVFKKVIWRGTLALGESIEQFTTWTITGIAAIVALLVSNLDSISQTVSAGGLRGALILFTVSLLAAVTSKQIGMAVANGLKTISQVEHLLNSEQGQRLMNRMSTDPRQLVQELAEPFLWPLSTLTRRAGKRGLSDYLSTDKRFIRLLCIQIYINALHGILATAALLTLALSIRYA